MVDFKGEPERAGLAVRSRAGSIRKERAAPKGSPHLVSDRGVHNRLKAISQ